MFLEISQNSQENTCAGVLLKKTPAQLFSSEFCEIFKNTHFGRTSTYGSLWLYGSLCIENKIKGQQLQQSCYKVPDL